MRKLTIPLLSFSAGALCMFLFGNQASTVLQPPVLAQKVEGAIPVVPPLRHIVTRSNAYENMVYAVDGIESNGDRFNNVTFEYGGGAYKLENATVSGKVNINLIGAAANTAIFLRAFGLLGCPAAAPKSPLPNPNIPVIQSATLKTPVRGDIVSPFGQK